MDSSTNQTIQASSFSRWQPVFIIFICLAITACEYIFAYQDVAYGIVIAMGLVILIYVMLSLFRFDERTTICAESLTLLPLYVLFTASLPWFFISQDYLLPAVYSCILALCLWHIYQKKLSLTEIFDFSHDNEKSTKEYIYYLLLVIMGFGIGAVTGTVEYFILTPAPAFPIFEVKYLLRDILYMFFFVSVGEELLFRGLIQRNMIEALGCKSGIFATAIMFAVMHLTWRSTTELAFVFCAGLLLGAVYWKTKSLLLPIIIHGTNNVILVSVLPYIMN